MGIASQVCTKWAPMPQTSQAGSFVKAYAVPTAKNAVSQGGRPHESHGQHEHVMNAMAQPAQPSANGCGDHRRQDDGRADTQAQPPLNVIGRDPLMRRGANRGPASTTERKWLCQPYLKIMAGLTPENIIVLSLLSTRCCRNCGLFNCFIYSRIQK